MVFGILWWIREHGCCTQPLDVHLLEILFRVGTFLHSARYPEFTTKVIKRTDKLRNTWSKVLFIGGDGSYHGAMRWLSLTQLWSSGNDRQMISSELTLQLFRQSQSQWTRSIRFVILHLVTTAFVIEAMGRNAEISLLGRGSHLQMKSSLKKTKIEEVVESIKEVTQKVVPTTSLFWLKAMSADEFVKRWKKLVRKWTSCDWAWPHPTWWFTYSDVTVLCFTARAHAVKLLKQGIGGVAWYP